MDEEKVLVIIKGEDKTKEIEYLSENNNKKINVKFYNKETTYQYNEKNVIIKEQAEKIDFNDKDIVLLSSFSQDSTALSIIFSIILHKSLSFMPNFFGNINNYVTINIHIFQL